MSNMTPEDIFIDYKTGLRTENENYDAAAQYIRGDITDRWAREHDAEITRLRAELAERDAELARLRELHGKACEIAAEYRQRAEQPRTDAEWKAADRRKRIEQRTAEYAGQIAAARLAALDAAYYADQLSRQEPYADYVHNKLIESLRAARALAAAVVEAEE